MNVKGVMSDAEKKGRTKEMKVSECIVQDAGV